MFTGIIENLGKVLKIENTGTNKNFLIESKLAPELKIDQSLAHNGVCLTVVALQNNSYIVTAIDETLKKTNLGNLKTGDFVNLERCMVMNGRIDGHIVQGHVDQTGICTGKADQNGSWIFDFEYSSEYENVTVEKGSMCINGVSLTVFNSGKNSFSVAIIPYTFENTTFKQVNTGDTVNLEFDIVGKYLKKFFEFGKTNTI